MVEQIVLTGLGVPQPLFGVDASGGHHRMDVGVSIQSAGMGVQLGDGTGCALKVFVVAAEGEQGLLGALYQQAVEGPRFGQSQGAEFRFRMPGTGTVPIV